ncbi:hypothetical protein SJ963_07725, partial [Enterococcus faecium]
IVEKNDGEISGIYLVACGGSLVDMYGCNPTARSLRDRSFVFSSVGLTHRKRLVELWLLFKIH